MAGKVRVAIIGAGAVADYHHVPGIKLDPRGELVAVCDPNEKLLAKRQQDWGPTKQTTNYQEIAADPDIDAVIICTPNFTHLPIALACLEGGKHVMCEKPLGLNFEESRADVPGRARSRPAAHDRLHLPLRSVDALSEAPGRHGAPRHSRGTSAASGFSTGRRRAGAGGNTRSGRRRRPVRHDDPPDRLRAGPAGADATDLRRRRPVRSPRRQPRWHAVPPVGSRRLVGLDRPVRTAAASACGKGPRWPRAIITSGFGHEWAEVNGSEALGRLPA